MTSPPPYLNLILIHGNILATTENGKSEHCPQFAG